MGKPSKFGSLDAIEGSQLLVKGPSQLLLFYCLGCWRFSLSCCCQLFSLLPMSSRWRMVSECTPVEPPLFSTMNEKKERFNLLTACRCSVCDFF